MLTTGGHAGASIEIDLLSFVALAFFLSGVVAVVESGALRFGGILVESQLTCS